MTIVKFNGINWNKEQFEGCSYSDFKAACMQFRFFKEILPENREAKIKEAYAAVVGTEKKPQKKQIEESQGSEQ